MELWPQMAQGVSRLSSGLVLGQEQGWGEVGLDICCGKGVYFLSSFCLAWFVGVGWEGDRGVDQSVGAPVHKVIFQVPLFLSSVLEVGSL